MKSGSGDLVIEPGRTITFRYRVVIHSGDAQAAQLNVKFREFAGITAARW